MRCRRSSLIAVLLLALAAAPAARAADGLRAIAGRSFYMSESQGELILLGDPGVLGRSDLRAYVFWGGALLAEYAPVAHGRRATVAFDLQALPAGAWDLTCVLTGADGSAWTLPARVVKLPPRANAVQIDRVSGGLIVEGLPFFPFGFYCYSPVQPTLAEEEVVKGFNVMAPYQSNDPAGLADRRRYMDRCAQLGMKVHYQLLGAVGRLDGSPESELLLRTEVAAFRDHPALLAWYISDEPTGHGTTPEELRRAYEIVREVDPYHPVTIVFMRPARAVEYAAAMDVAMCDPYVIPHNPPGAIAPAVDALVSTLGDDKPAWLVPQAFGGNEWWPREPTRQEIRVMTYLGLIQGATGIQYFVRHGLNGFPKSTSTWAECGRMALEVAELTPALLSREARPAVTTSAESVRAAAWRDRGRIVILAVNLENRPQEVQLAIQGLDFSGPATVLFESRQVDVIAGALLDMIDAYGTRAYEILVAPPDDDLTADPRNLILDPSFEDISSVGTPAACYADVGEGRGATYFVDSRVARHGQHSVRLVTPVEGQGVELRPYAAQVQRGRVYRASLWARARDEGAVLHLTVPGVGERNFSLSTDWQEYALEGRVAEDVGRTWPRLGLVSPGVAWVDLLQLTPMSPAVTARSDVFTDALEVTMDAGEPGVELRYTLDNADPGPDSPLYSGPLRLTDSATVKAAAFRGGRVAGAVTQVAFTRLPYLDAVQVDRREPGLEYEYYEGKWDSLPDFGALQPAAVGAVAGFDISPRRRDDHFAFRFSGYIEVPRDGIYTFTVTSGGACKLLIGGREVVNNEALHGRTRRSGRVALRAGLHAIVVTLLDFDGAESLDISWRGPDLATQPIPPSALWRAAR